MKRLLLVTATLLSACAQVPDIPMPDTRAVPLIGSGIAPVTVTDSFVAAEARLRDAIGARDLRLFAVVDHGAGALTVGRDIGASKLFIFGNPAGGTPLMESDPEMGLALPLKILIYTDAGGRARILYPDMRALADDYDLDDQEERLKMMDGLLRTMAREAAG